MSLSARPICGGWANSPAGVLPEQTNTSDWYLAVGCLAVALSRARRKTDQRNARDKETPSERPVACIAFYVPSVNIFHQHTVVACVCAAPLHAFGLMLLWPLAALNKTQQRAPLCAQTSANEKFTALAGPSSKSLFFSLLLLLCAKCRPRIFHFILAPVKWRQMVWISNSWRRWLLPAKSFQHQHIFCWGNWKHGFIKFSDCFLELCETDSGHFWNWIACTSA